MPDLKSLQNRSYELLLCVVPLHVGLMVDTAEAAVYQLKEGGEMKGVLISSEAMGGGGEDEE